jgi:hypothetical protein
MSWTESEKLNEWIERAFENGKKEEQERIIKLLKEDKLGLVGCGCCAEANMEDVIALIKGEQ